MPVRLSFSFYGEHQLDRTLNRMIADVEDATPAWEVILASFIRAERKQFRSQGAYGSAGWVPLSPRYAAWKALHFPGKPILERTGRLLRSLTQQPLGIEVMQPHRLLMGSNVKYGEFHQAGSGHLPRRRPIELPESLRVEWVKTLQRYIVTGYATARPTAIAGTDLLR